MHARSLRKDKYLLPRVNVTPPFFLSPSSEKKSEKEKRKNDPRIKDK
jgi:hypothetical protein